MLQAAEEGLTQDWAHHPSSSPSGFSPTACILSVPTTLPLHAPPHYSRLPHNPHPIKCILLDESHTFEQHLPQALLFHGWYHFRTIFTGTHFLGPLQMGMGYKGVDCSPTFLSLKYLY